MARSIFAGLQIHLASVALGFKRGGKTGVCEDGAASEARMKRTPCTLLSCRRMGSYNLGNSRTLDPISSILALPDL